MSYQIDHLFVLSACHRAASRSLVEAGFSLAPRRVHSGQGTANACVHLENGYLEILWVERPDEVKSTTTRPTGLAERSCWTETGASPVGIALRARDEAAPSFPCFAYRPAYMPGAAAIMIADEPIAVGAPLIFVLPPELKGRAVAVDHANGARRITSMTVLSTLAPARSPALALLQECGLCHIEIASAPGLAVELDHGRQGQRLELAPETPLTLLW